MLSYIIIVSLTISIVLFIWLKTNVFVDLFGWLLSGPNIAFVKDYKKSPNFAFLEYPLWLYTEHPCFLTKLISCPLCLSFWVNVLVWGLYFSEWTLCLAGAALTLIAFGVLDKLYHHTINGP